MLRVTAPIQPYLKLFGFFCSNRILNQIHPAFNLAINQNPPIALY